MEEKWYSFAYQYCLGGLFFIFSIIYLIRVKAFAAITNGRKSTIIQIAAGFISILLLNVVLIIASGR